MMFLRMLLVVSTAQAFALTSIKRGAGAAASGRRTGFPPRRTGVSGPVQGARQRSTLPPVHQTVALETPASTVDSTTLSGDDLDSKQSAQDRRNSGERWDSFDYLQQWYPISWDIDMIPDKVMKFTLFDVDYAVVLKSVKDKGEEPQVMAFLDACPHRKAALSEGRLTASGYLQCAYHGWSFRGETGECVQIPQAASPLAGSFPCATAIPACLHQGMVWLWPNGQEPPRGKLPPKIPEIDEPGFRMVKAVRDFPEVDWSLLLSNIMDPVSTCLALQLDICWGRAAWNQSSASPGFRCSLSSHIGEDVSGSSASDLQALVARDRRRECLSQQAHCALRLQDHGMFAHQLPAAFDYYSGSSQHPMAVEEEFPDGGRGWTMKTSVEAVDKLRKADDAKRAEQETANGKKKSKSQSANEEKAKPPLATVTFQAPCVVNMCRRNQDTNETSFSTCFWVTPIGAGKSRFMSAAVGKLPVRPPRWVQHLFLNSFLDQDTVMVASQQPHTLLAEAQSIQLEDPAATNDNQSTWPRYRFKTPPRQSSYEYRSPSDRQVRLLDKFWDATVCRSPNRFERLQELQAKGELRQIPDRNVILDRKIQHLDICPDSQAVVRNCERLRRASIMVASAWLLVRAVTFVGAANLAPQPSSGIVTRALRLAARLFRPIAWPIAAAFVVWICSTIRRGFFFSYGKDRWYKDLSKIPNVWLDPE